MTYKQLTLEQRYQLCTLKKMNVLQKDIATELGVNPSTINVCLLTKQVGIIHGHQFSPTA
jgi:IS30 family transposase